MASVGGTAPRGLDRHTLTGPALSGFAFSASAPLTAVAGGIVAALAGTGIAGVAVAFVLLTAGLALFASCYVSMARHLPHPGPLYAHIARGLGPVAGTGAAGVVLLSYNAIQVCLYGLLGSTLAGLFGGPWWLWALAAWLIIAALGVSHVGAMAQILAVLLVVEVAVVVAFDVAAFARPAGGSVDLSSLAPGQLFGDGVGLVLAFAVACFVGFESPMGYVEEARTPRAVVSATLWSLLGLGGLYVLSAVAVVNAVGDDLTAATPEVIFRSLDETYGLLVYSLANILLVTSIVAAALSFHGTVARYLYALGRERVLPGRFATVRRSGVPVAGSLAQTGMAAAVIVGWAALGLDPMSLFGLGAAVAALGLLSVMAVGCIAIRRFYQRGGARESWWTRVAAPTGGLVVLGAVVAVMASNLHALIGAEAGSVAVWTLVGLLVLAAAGGAARGLALRLRRPDVASGIGAGQTEPLRERKSRFADITI